VYVFSPRPIERNEWVVISFFYVQIEKSKSRRSLSLPLHKTKLVFKISKLRSSSPLVHFLSSFSFSTTKQLNQNTLITKDASCVRPILYSMLKRISSSSSQSKRGVCVFTEPLLSSPTPLNLFFLFPNFPLSALNVLDGEEGIDLSKSTLPS
jgi:hypothetical protein